MSEDITKVYEEYSEQILFCKYFIAEHLKHNAEMGRCGEKILLKELSKRFGMLEFVSGFVVCKGNLSPQSDILVCRSNMYKRPLDGGLYIVNPIDCLMIIEVKGNLTLADISETNRKNQYFKDHDETKHIQLALFAYKTRIGKKSLLNSFGYKYQKEIMSFYQKRLDTEMWIDLFICLHRESMNTSVSRDKQLFVIKDRQNGRQYFLDNNYPVIQSFFRYMQSLQE
ncbi:hypothetical protein PAT3040_03519 [Paenibacillus agaridevorans]|uniref:DUF6602 domain-containing protein n=1 Tax=Paenibacillus agaridevorans TaxID=171404 RepID=A0A2R5EQC1_9BACL|nr:DUF6602 domain-containing protein [Paenibacillus agaridevorans]GBG08906.1 hypothetical protein PAT3040_03519 [Paenibacillus agaridevorans]